MAFYVFETGAQIQRFLTALKNNLWPQLFISKMRTLSGGVISPTATGAGAPKKVSPKKILRKLWQKEQSGKDLVLELQSLNISKLEAVCAHLGLEKHDSKRATADAVAVTEKEKISGPNLNDFLLESHHQA